MVIIGGGGVVVSDSGNAVDYSLCPWDFPCVEGNFLLQGIFLTQRWNPGLLHSYSFFFLFFIYFY